MSLIARISTDNSQFISGMKHASGEVKKLATEAAGLAGIGLSLEGGKEYIKALIENLTQVGAQARNAGESAEEFQKWQYAFDVSKVGSEKFVLGLVKMSDIIEKAVEGSDEAKNKIGRLGLTLHDLDGKTPSEQMGVLLDAFNRFSGTANEKMSLAKDIFGKTGKSISNLAANWRELTAEAGNSGNLFNENSIEQAEKIERSVKQIHQAIANVVAGSGLLEYLKDVLAELNQIISKFPTKKEYTDAGMDKKNSLNDLAEAKLREEDNKKLIGRKYSKHDNGILANIAGSPDDIELPVPQADKDAWIAKNYGEKRALEESRKEQKRLQEEQRQAEEKARRKHIDDLNTQESAYHIRENAKNQKYNKVVNDTVSGINEQASGLDKTTQALKEQSELQKTIFELKKKLKELDENMPQEKINAAVQSATEAYQKLAAAEEKVRSKEINKSLKEKFQDLRWNAMQSSGNGLQAEKERLQYEFEQKNGGKKLDAASISRIDELAVLNDKLNHAPAPQKLEGEYTNSLARVGGFTGSVGKMDIGRVNESILAESRRHTEILNAATKAIQSLNMGVK